MSGASSFFTIEFFCLLKIPRIGAAISLGLSAAVATCYSSGWKRW
jgi:hypothetical protein